MSAERKQLTPIGTIEHIDFPDDGVYGVPAKIDTGADSSAIWASDIELEDEMLAFKLFGPSSELYKPDKVIKTTTFKTARVKNSFGQVELRYKVKIRVKLGTKTLVRWCNLADRSNNTFPVLLGKNFLKNIFTVDVSQKHIASDGISSRSVLVLGSQSNDAFIHQIDKKLPQTDIYSATYDDLVYTINGLNTAVSYHGPHQSIDIAQYDLVYFKSHNRAAEFAAAAAEYLTFRNRRFVDKEVGTYTSMSKLSEYMKLACGGLAVPNTICASSEYLLSHYGELVTALGSPFVLKEIASDRGRNNYLISSESDFESIFLQAKKAMHFLVQAYVPNDGFYRLYVLARKTTLVVHRASTPHEDPLKVHLNKPKGGANATKIAVEELPIAAVALAEQAAEHMNRQVAGVDLIQDRNTGAWYVLEVNNAPQLRTGAFTDQKVQILAEFLDKELNR